MSSVHADAEDGSNTAALQQPQHLVFVYGTLKSGQPNNARLLEYMDSDISVVGKAVTRYPYPLVLATDYNVPFLINEICYTAKRVSGELFSVSSHALAFLDYVESTPTLYCRERIEVDLQIATAADPPDDVASSAETGQPGKQPSELMDSAASVESRWCWCYFLAHHNPNLVAPPFYSEYDSAKTPMRLNIQSLTQQDEEQIKRVIAKEVQIMPM
uniref:Gamma-glutamylcyclotransferase family protein n=1 Tax=Macrostomum lignano TaxID=282301 RepID=A0A1I8I2E5_9PLAT